MHNDTKNNSLISKTTLCIMTLSKMATCICIKTLRITKMTLNINDTQNNNPRSIRALSITKMTLNINDTQNNNPRSIRALSITKLALA